MIKVYRCYSNPSRMDRLETFTCKTIKFLSERIGKLAERVTYAILTTVARAVPISLWIGIPVAIAVCFDSPVDTPWKAFAIIVAFAAWNVLCFLVGVYLCYPGKPENKNH